VFLEAAGGTVLAAVAGAAPAAAVSRPAGASGPASDATSGPRYCIFSKHLPDLGWADLAAATIDMGFDGIDLTVRPRGHVLPERVREDLPRAVEAVRAKGTTISMVTTEITSADQPTARTILEAAGKAGIGLVKVGYWKYALKDVRAEVAAMGRDLAGLAVLAKQHGVAIGVHNHHGNLGSALWDIAPHIDALDPAAIGYYFDPRHALAEGGGVGWKAATLLTAPRMKMVAVKDLFWAKGPKGWVIENCPMGEGMVDWGWFSTALARSSFAGPISVHLEYRIPGSTPEALRRSTMEAATRDLAFIKRHVTAARETEGRR
jgi:sugar phosphate isomerase/epimerase